jgi:hypothetical protein
MQYALSSFCITFQGLQPLGKPSHVVLHAGHIRENNFRNVILLEKVWELFTARLTSFRTATMRLASSSRAERSSALGHILE